ncbi:MAG: 50S ribosomal protein L10 [Lentisphaeria bacterium]|nr:50S ribosomal protein L10 [Lentisphaeria bacterium]
MRAEKNQLVRDIQGLVELAPSLFLIRYKGLDSTDFGELRTVLAAVGSQCHVVPNRLFKRAVLDSGVECLTEFKLVDDTALVCGGDDAVAVAKVLRDYQKKHEEAAIKCAVLEDELLSPEQVFQLAALPPKEVLQAQLLGLLQASAGQLVRVLNAKLTSVVYVVNAYLNKKEQEQAA